MIFNELFSTRLPFEHGGCPYHVSPWEFVNNVVILYGMNMLYGMELAHFTINLLIKKITWLLFVKFFDVKMDRK